MEKIENTNAVNNDEQINLLEYTYAPEDVVSIPGMALVELMMFAKAVATNEEKVGLAFSYPKKTKEVYGDDKKFLVAVESEGVKEYPTATAFFNQQPQSFTSLLGASAQDALMKLQSVHLQNIKSGLSKIHGNFVKEEVKL